MDGCYKKPSNIHKPWKNLGCLFSAFRASCVQQLGVRLPLKAIISCSSRLRGLTALHKHLTVLLTVFFFRLVPRLLLQLHPPAAKSRPAGIIGPPVHLFLPFTLPESSSSHMHWGREGGRRHTEGRSSPCPIPFCLASQTNCTFIFVP